ncbi:hypothetical protein [Mobiluncus curtisii]|uniref:hypothetical protein n=1 Tax=Mobiluncus curtisii TaxID=2051 RepID=UPI00146FD81E|nr:hypothetical protein [Mobiluncus curtisii]NMW88018.1 hypothetical protein [Mobiluncus curtisii]
MVGNTQRPVPWQGPNPNQARPHPQNPPARQIDNKARRRWTIAIIVAGVILVALVIGLVMMWMMGGGSQGARSACTKASQDLTKQYTSLQQVVSDAENTLATVDSTQVKDPKMLDDMQAKVQQASKEIKPLKCSGKDVAKKTSTMMAQTDALKKLQTELEAVLRKVQGTENLSSLKVAQKALEDKIAQAEKLAQTAADLEANTEPRASLAAQIEDAKRLLDQVNSLSTVPDDKVNSLNESMRASADRLDEDITAVTKAIDDKRLEQAQKESEEQMLLQQQQMEQERRAQQSSATCEVGQTTVDADGNKFLCRNVLDPTTGRGQATWVLEPTEQPQPGN